jgi:hypothetical protein
MLAFFYGASGSLALEFLNVREQYGKMRAKRFRQMIRSPEFWIFNIGLILSSGLFASIVHYGATTEHGPAVFLAGAGFRSFGREAIGAVVHNRAIVQGASEDQITFRDILT